MKTTITFEIDDDQLTGYTDEYISQLWHIAQANPATFADVQACTLVESLSREIARRWLAATPPQLWAHQGRHIVNAVTIAARA